MIQNKGFSIIEVMIVTALIAVSSLGVVELYNMQTRSVNAAEIRFDSVDFSNQIRSILSNTKSCSQTVSGIQFNNDSILTTIKRVYKNPTTGVDTTSDVISVNNNVSNKLKLVGLSLVNVNASKGQADLKIVTENISPSAYGSKQHSALIPLSVVPNPNNPSLVGGCVAAGSTPIDPIEMCTFIGGTYNQATQKCEAEVDIDTTAQPEMCSPGSKQQLVYNAQGQPRIKCIPCQQIFKFDRSDCGKPFKGMNWVNMCYYKTVCADNQNIVLFEGRFDNKAGPTSASGGDTGTKKNCFKKRRACAGE